MHSYLAIIIQVILMLQYVSGVYALQLQESVWMLDYAETGVPPHPGPTDVLVQSTWRLDGQGSFPESRPDNAFRLVTNNLQAYINKWSEVNEWDAQCICLQEVQLTRAMTSRVEALGYPKWTYKFTDPLPPIVPVSPIRTHGI